MLRLWVLTLLIRDPTLLSSWYYYRVINVSAAQWTWVAPKIDNHLG
jgi:hypothetical protein